MEIMFFLQIERILRIELEIGIIFLIVIFTYITADEKKYIQVTESMMSEDVRKRELAPLQSIRDNYEKNVLSLEPGFDASYDGIKSENLIEWLLRE